MSMRTSQISPRKPTHSERSLTDFNMTESLAEAKFTRSESPSHQEFFKNVKQFSRELKSREKYIKSTRISIKKRSFIDIEPKCHSFTEKTLRNLPKLSKKVIDYAIEMKLLREEDLKNLIVDPNKYSIFFEKHDFSSPFTRNALNNLGLSLEQVLFPDFKDFEDAQIPKINQILSYLIDLNKKYERIKRVLRERNRLKALDREIRRRFPQYERLTLEETMKSIESLNETLQRPVEKHLKLYLNHANTYSFEEKKAKNSQKSELFKQNMRNYIENLAGQRFDSEVFLQNSRQKLEKTRRNKAKKLKEITKKAQELVEPVSKKVLERKKFEAEQQNERFLEKTREIFQQDAETQARVFEEKRKLREKIENFSQKREKYQFLARNLKATREMQENLEEERKFKAITEKSESLERKRCEIREKLEETRAFHAEKLRKVQDDCDNIEKLRENARIKAFLEGFQRKYEASQGLRADFLKKKVAKQSVNSRLCAENLRDNREKILQRMHHKEEFFKEKLRADAEKVQRAQNIKEFIRRKTISDVEEKWQKFRANHQENAWVFNEKRASLLMKDVATRKKIEMNRKENDFVVEERRDYNNKLSKYRQEIEKNVKV